MLLAPIGLTKAFVHVRQGLIQSGCKRHAVIKGLKRPETEQYCPDPSGQPCLNKATFLTF